MGELALRKIQGGIETVRGTPVVGSRNLYGIMTITREQARRFADEDRGSFIKYWRANPKLIDAGFKLEADLTPEDFPYFLETIMQGGVSPTGTAPTGYLWSYAPDLTSDLIKTRTYYAGDEAVQWRGAFGASDTLDVAIDLNDAVKLTLGGFVQDWIPVTSGFLTTGFSGGFAGLSDRTVESIMGYQSKLMIDAAGGTMGTTQVVGKFISAKLHFALNNKRKPFGDNLAYSLQKLGRGSRDVTCQIVFEGANQSEFADHFLNVEKQVRIQHIGSVIPASTYGTISAGIVAGTIYTTLPTNALTSAIAGGVAIDIGGNVFTVAPAGAASAATTIPVLSQAASVAASIGTTVAARKTINFDFWGYWDNFSLGNRDTNTTFQLTLQAVNDVTSALDHRIAVLNQNNLAAGIS
jgi:hypothetical protein